MLSLEITMYRKKEEIRCPDCNKKFTDQRSLVDHQRGKHKKKKYGKSKR